MYQEAFQLHDLFEEQLQRTPDGIALEFQDARITFAELAAQSNQLAALIEARGLREGGFIGLHLERSIRWVVSALAILKSNCAVVPLPPSYPKGRLVDILEFSQLDAIIDDVESSLDAIVDANVSRHVIHFEDAATASEVYAPRTAGHADQPAFVLCSSGSTGKPKMIVRSHRSFRHRLEWTWSHHPYTSDDVCCQKAHMTTTHAIYELFEPLLRGAPVCIISDQHARTLEAFWGTVRTRGVSRLLIVPSALQASLDMPEFAPPGVKVLVLMGERVTPGLAARAVAAFPAATHIYSMYGSTEASSTFVCDIRASLRPGEELPLGQPIPATVHPHVLRESLVDDAAPGEIGMLYMGGSALFTEYFRDPALTASAFVTRPGSDERLYRTQDQVRLMPDGSLHFVGRIDHAVKVRGHRVDLQEVEQAVLRHPDVRQCSVILNDRDPSSAMLLAFVVPASVSQASVYQVVRERLPAYMHPSAVVALDAFPLTTSQKIDRQQLLESFTSASSSDRPDRCHTETERRVAAIWRELLHHGDVHPESSFFEVGGTSLSVFAAVHRLREAFALDRQQLTGLSMYQYPTVEALASCIDSLRSGSALVAMARDAILVSLKPGTNTGLPPLFAIPSAGGTLGAYEKLVDALEMSREIVGVRDPFNWGDRDPTLGFKQWVAIYLKAMRQRQPHGPYHLMAYSSAGAFGYEMAQQLRRDGESVGLLALIDPLGLDSSDQKRYGYWALRARFMRESFARTVRRGGRLRSLVPRVLRASGRGDTTKGWALTREAFDAFAETIRANREHILRVSALLELNTGLPFALTESELPSGEPGRYLERLLTRVQQVAPEVDLQTIANLVVQYALQARAQTEYQIRRYDGNAVLFEPDSPHQGLIAAQLRPYIKSLRVRGLPVGPVSVRSRELIAAFPEGLRPHYLSMRDDRFVDALARDLETLLVQAADGPATSFTPEDLDVMRAASAFGEPLEELNQSSAKARNAASHATRTSNRRM